MYYVIVSKIYATGKIYRAERTETTKEIYLPHAEAVKTLRYYDPNCLFDDYDRAQNFLTQQLANHPARLKN